MKQITTVGLDLAKTVFQVHAIDAAGSVVVRRQVRRAQMLLFFSRLSPCLIGIEGRQGCAIGSSNRWRRRISLLGAGTGEARP